MQTLDLKQANEARISFHGSMKAWAWTHFNIFRPENHSKIITNLQTSRKSFQKMTKDAWNIDLEAYNNKGGKIMIYMHFEMIRSRNFTYPSFLCTKSNFFFKDHTTSTKIQKRCKWG